MLRSVLYCEDLEERWKEAGSLMTIVRHHLGTDSSEVGSSRCCDSPSVSRNLCGAFITLGRCADSANFSCFYFSYSLGGCLCLAALLSPQWNSSPPG